jgi:HAD superfamily hydrolase (TIGR01509 family)
MKREAGQFEAVLFDMDGVLVDSEIFIAEAAIKMFAEHHGVRVREEDFLPFVGAGENRYLGGVAALYGIDQDVERDKARTYEIYGEIIRGRLKELPGAAEFVERCRTSAIAVALATSADEIKMISSLREIDLPVDSFDVRVNGLEVEHKKPAPDIYLEAARRLGVDPARCLVVEDAVNGVQSGKAAGARVLGITSSFGEDELRGAGADYIAADLAEALKYPPPGLW